MSRACHYQGTTAANPIADIGDSLADHLRSEVDSLRKQYFELSEKVSNHAYMPSSDQIIDMRRLGQLAELIGRLEDARAAANHCRCWLD